MIKYIIFGGLVGFLLGINSVTMIGWDAWIGGQVTYNLWLSFVADKLANDFSIAIVLVFLIPIITYALLGYIIGHFLKQK